MSFRKRLLLATVIGLTVGGCGSNGSMGADVSGANQQQDYGATKQMVVDILHSSEGKKAVTEIVTDPQVKNQLIVSETDVSKAVEKMLQSKQGQTFMSEQAKDPKFASALSDAAQPTMVKIMKQLMKDPAYQKDLMVLLKSPDFTKSVEELLQTPQFRGQIMKIMTDALQTPSFRMQFQDALKQAVSDSMQSAGGQSGSQGGSSQSGGQGGGGGGSSGGQS